ncbi:MAG: LamG domain-containing protein [Armatimonadetes bacterium]|nr:LamG domain-containing protein [Armatimonadota bacterium]
MPPCLLALCVMAADPGLLAWYPCDEATGTVLHDHSGNGRDLTLHGGRFVPYGDGYALSLNGRGDHLTQSAGAPFEPAGAVSVEAWVQPQGAAKGEPGVVGRSYTSFVLTWYTDGKCWWYVGGGGSHVSAALTTGVWHHVVGTFDGKLLKLFVDGREAASGPCAVDKVPPGEGFFLGTSTGEVQFTQQATFEGLLDEIRIYDRALAADEIAKRFRATHLTGEIAAATQLAVYDHCVTALLDLRGLGELAPETRVRLELRRGKQVVSAADLPAGSATDLAADLRLPSPQPGDYELRCSASAGGKPVGKPATQRVTWPAAPPKGPLNNLVTALLDQAKPPQRVEIAVPREGWLYLAVTPRATGAAPELALDGQPAPALAYRGALEVMRQVPAGKHTLTLSAPADRVVARIVPELGFAQYGAHPHVHEYGKYDQAFLLRHVMPHVNVMIGPGSGGEAADAIREWRGLGRLWMASAMLPGISGPITAAEAEAQWRAQPGFADPLLDGQFVDEFGGQDQAHYDAWTEAAEKLAADPALRGRKLYPYCAPIYAGEWQQRFCRTVLAHGGKFAFERYLGEQRTANDCIRFIHNQLADAVNGWRQTLPGVESRLIVTLGTFSQPPESLDVNPDIDLKVYLDRQMYTLANDPACRGLGGVLSYLSSYTDEETVRWVAKLFRHYAIEGRAGHLTRDPLTLGHLTNPDFTDGLSGWTVKAAEPDSVTADTVRGLGWLEGRYPEMFLGQAVLRMRRSDKAPNVVSQTIRGLQPGRWYALRCFSADGGDMAVQQKLGLNVTVDAVDANSPGCFQHVFASCYSHHFGPFNDKHPAWLNYHWLVFKAAHQTAEVRLSDWAAGKAAGPIGQAMVCNFLEVQPYDPAR